MTCARLLGIVLLASLCDGCVYFRPRPPKYEWVDLGAHLRTLEVVVPIEGPEVRVGDEVLMHYDLALEGGTPVESSRERGQPIQVVLGRGLLPAGLERGMLGMRLLGRRTVIVPPDLAYGHAGRPPFIPPDATLVFDVEILGLRPAVAGPGRGSG